MYKVFINNKPIVLTSSFPKDKKYPIYFGKDIIFEELLHRLKTTSLKGIYIYSENIEKYWNKFCGYFKVVSSAGGLVVNPKKEVLFIYRGNKWDLPKGHIEEGETKAETAVREVEEECGIKNLKLDKFLTTTYHIYYEDNVLCLKETFWFLMFSDYSGELTPQLEEGIVKVEFKNKENIEKSFSNTFDNIKLVYNTYLHS